MPAWHRFCSERVAGVACKAHIAGNLNVISLLELFTVKTMLLDSIGCSSSSTSPTRPWIKTNLWIKETIKKKKISLHWIEQTMVKVHVQSVYSSILHIYRLCIIDWWQIWTPASVWTVQ